MRTRWILAATAIVLVVGVTLWLLSRRQPASPVADLDAAIAENERGVGLMNAFKYKDAAEAFARAEAAAPGWRVARLNRAIALYNQGGSSDNVRAANSELSQSIGILSELINADPNDVAARYNLGIIRLTLNDIDEALTQFTRVTELDPADGHAWLLRYRSMPDGSESPEGYESLKRALSANPYLNAARYSLAQHALTPPGDRAKVLAEFNELADSQGDIEYAESYSDMGKYALVVSQPPKQLAAVGTIPIYQPFINNQHAVPTQSPVPDELQARFGAVTIGLDFDRDGRTDFLVIGADAGDRLLRSRGDGTLEDVTEAAKLTGRSVGGAAADYNNDGYIDLLLATPAGVKLYKNVDGKYFDDVTAEAGLETLTGHYLTAQWSDFDLDGDLDFVLVRRAVPPDTGGVELFANVGDSPPSGRGSALLPLTTRFKKSPLPNGLDGPTTGVVCADLDGDHDPDLLVLRDGQVPQVVLNDRLLRFTLGAPIAGLPAGDYQGGLTVQVSPDGQSDVVLLRHRAPPLLLVSRRGGPEPAATLTGRFDVTELAPRPLTFAQAVDLDRDGRTDLVGLAEGGALVAYLQAESRQFVEKAEPFGPAGRARWLGFLLAELTAEARPDLVARSAGGLETFRAGDTGRHAVILRLSGLRERREPGNARVLRANADGLGTYAEATTANTRAAVEHYPQTAGLGQSMLPVTLGTGTSATAETVRLRWPDALVQAELDVPTDTSVTLTETSRKPTSCPVLLAWDGRAFRYVTDFLGAGALAEMTATGDIRPPRPEESVKLEPGTLQLDAGHYTIKIAEPMDEVLYLDHVMLSVIDHPKTWMVHPDERFTTAEPAASQNLLAFDRGEQLFAGRVSDHRGNDRTGRVRHRDGQTVDDFHTRSWLGYAEEHALTLDFGESLQKLPADRPVYLVLAGWTDYPFPESIYAATQAGCPTIAPVLEQRRPDGTWKTLTDIGFPAGLPRVITKEVTGLVVPAGGPLRIRTNLRIYWDEISLCPLANGPLTVADLPPASADLAHRGFMQEVTLPPHGPIAYDPGRVEPVAVTRWAGALTKLGRVTELVAAHDDRLVLCGPGDELAVSFDGSKLPPVADSYERSFVLRAKGYTKDTAPTTVTGGQVGPMPFRAMPGYPYPNELAAPHPNDLRDWHTRRLSR